MGCKRVAEKGLENARESVENVVERRYPHYSIPKTAFCCVRFEYS